jgi:excisionase family DNA binding protein
MIARISTPLTRLRTIDETAALLAVSKRTVQRLIESGALRAHRLGRAVRISDADIAAFLDDNRDGWAVSRLVT